VIRRDTGPRESGADTQGAGADDGCVAPQCASGDGESIATAPLATLVEKIRQLGGTPEWLLSDPSVWT
jgi:hypothetical protein